MLVKLKKLTLRNFLSVGNATIEIDLNVPGTMLILGKNIDRENSPNAVGKTTISNAISYVLFNKPLDPISKEKLINSTNASKKTEMGVTLGFSIGETEYLIKRGRGSEYDARLYINGEDKTPDSIDNLNKKIVEIIGISYELFRRTVIFRGSDLPFFDMPVSQQRGLIEELFKITTLSEKADILKKNSAQTDKDISILEAQIQLKEKAAEKHKAQLKEAEVRILAWEQNKIATRAKLEKELKEASEIDFEAQENFIIKRDKALSIFNDADAERRQINQDLVEYKKELTKAQKELAHLRDQKCPYCLQKFDGAIDKISKLEDQEKEIEKELKNREQALAEVNKVIDTYGPVYVKYRDSTKIKNLVELQKLKASSTIIQEKLRANEESKNPHIEAYEKLNQEILEKIDYSKLDELKSDLEHQKFLTKLLTDKNSFIRKNIISRTLPFLNSRLYEHATNLGLPHKISFNADMGCTISQFGRESDYGNLSGGEKKRLNLATSRAFRDVSQYLHTTFNILILDEVDGGALGEDGVYAIINTLKDLAEEDKDLGIWIISHRPECVGKFDRTMMVKMENGFTSIESIIER